MWIAYITTIAKIKINIVIEAIKAKSGFAHQWTFIYKTVDKEWLKTQISLNGSFVISSDLEILTK